MGSQRKQSTRQILQADESRPQSARTGSRSVGAPVRGDLDDCANRRLGGERHGMRLGTILRLRLRSLFRRHRADVELEEELQYHVDRQIELEIASGRSPAEARYAA